MQTTPKKCPNCQLDNPDIVQICDCGYNFSTKQIESGQRGPIVPIFANLIVKVFVLIIIAIFVIFFEVLLKWVSNFFKP
jgi:hypothetical protein